MLTSEDIVLLKKGKRGLIIMFLIFFSPILLLALHTFANGRYKTVDSYTYIMYFGTVVLALFCSYYFVYHIGIKKINQTLHSNQKEILRSRLIKVEQGKYGSYIILSEGKFKFDPFFSQKLTANELKEGLPIILHFLINGKLMYAQQ